MVGTAAEVMSYLHQYTQPQDDFSCKISGAWLDECVKRAVRILLSANIQPRVLPERTVSGVQVDLSTCVAFSERTTDLTIEERRNLFTSMLGDLAQDARLTLLAESPQEDMM